MPRRPAALVLALLLGILAAPRSAHADAKVDMLVAEYDQAKQKFVAGQEAARDALLKRFDATIKAVTANTQIKAADRLAMADKLTEQRRLFANDGKLPTDMDMLSEVWKYATELDAKYRPVADKYNRALDAALKADEKGAVIRLQGDKSDFDEKYLPGRKRFAGKTTWGGTLYRAGSSTSFRLHLSEVTETSFKGVAERDLDIMGHPRWELAGSINGLAVTGRSGAAKQGSPPNHTYNGVVVGNRLILQVIPPPSKGKVTVLVAVLERAGK